MLDTSNRKWKGIMKGVKDSSNISRKMDTTYEF